MAFIGKRMVICKGRFLDNSKLAVWSKKSDSVTQQVRYIAIFSQINFQKISQ
jgi:hypothetical protein